MKSVFFLLFPTNKNCILFFSCVSPTVRNSNLSTRSIRTVGPLGTIPQAMKHVLLHLLVAVAAVYAVSEGARRTIVDLACAGEVKASFSKVKALKNSDLIADAGLLHVKSAFEYILNADNEKAVSLHKLGKSADGKLIPPLAEFYLKGLKCTGLADVFYLSAINIKQLVDSNLAVDAQLDGHMTLITLLSDTGLHHAAEKHLKAALALRPDDAALLFHSALMTPAVYESSESLLQTRALLEGRMRNLSLVKDLKLQTLDDFSLPPTFYLVYQGFNDKKFLTDLYENYFRAYKSLDDSETASFAASHRRPIRVGFVSSHLRRHSICKLFCGLIHHLNDQNSGNSTFDIYVFSTAPESKEDDHTSAIKNSCGTITTLGPRGVVAKSESKEQSTNASTPFVEFVRMDKSVLSNRNSVRSRNIDILVFLDIGMDPANLMWAATRLAPLQVVTWGHPSTTALPHIDYFVSSELFYQDTNRFINPARQDSSKQMFDKVTSESYSEQLMLLPSLGMFFSRPALHGQTIESLITRPVSFYESIRQRHIENADITQLINRILDSIHSDKPIRIILCPQQLPKFHPNFDNFIRSSLELDNNLVFVVINDAQVKYQWQRTLVHRWMRSIDGFGENTTRSSDRLTDRVLWLGRLDPQEYLSVLAVGDIMVDPYPFGGGVTTMEALSMCTPVITLPFQTVPALAAGMLTQLLAPINKTAHNGKYLKLLIAETEKDLVEKVKIILSNKNGTMLREAICISGENIFEQVNSAMDWSYLLRKIARIL